MRSFRFFICFVPAVCLLAQTPPPAPQPAPKPQQSGPPQPAPNVNLEVLQPKEGSLPEVPPDTVILKVGDEKVTAREFADFIETLPEQVRAQARGSARKQLAENMIKVKLLAQEARRQKADQDKAFKLQSSYQVDNLLAVYYLNSYLKNTKVSDEEMKKYYQEHKGDYETMRARHILIRFKGSRVPLKPDQKDLTQEEALAKANEVRKRLQTGADFAQVAKEESDDVGSGAQGGSLGEFRHGAMVGPFDEAAGKLPLGEISEPVMTPYGYHIIQVQAREAKTFDEVKDEIDKKLRPTLTDKYIDTLRGKLGVTMDESYFNTGTAPAK